MDYFAADDKRWERILPFITNTHPTISLRLLDFFVTCYARNVPCEWVNTDGSLFNVYHSMQSVLLGLNKRLIDPFKRHHPKGGANFVYRGVETNVPQLNFFRWALMNGVLDYVEKHVDAVRAEMRRVQQQKKKVTLQPSLALTTQIAGIVLPKQLVIEETPTDLKRPIETLQARIQGPKKRRKRLVEGAARSGQFYSSGGVVCLGGGKCV